MVREEDLTGYVAAWLIQVGTRLMIAVTQVHIHQLCELGLVPAQVRFRCGAQVVPDEDAVVGDLLLWRHIGELSLSNKSLE